MLLRHVLKGNFTVLHFFFPPITAAILNLPLNPTVLHYRNAD